MSSSRPRITVIIPTRERADVFEKSLLTCTAQNYADLSILVSDNSSQDNTRDIAFAANDKRVRYINTGQRLSMTHNYEFALSHVEDGWVTVIGDDDGLLPGAIGKVAEMISSTSVDFIRTATCLYRWPALLGGEFGSMAVPLKRGYEIRDAKEWQSRVIRGTELYPNLPMLYSGGFANSSLLKAIRSRTGQFYHSCIPDVYSAFAISSVIQRYAYSFEPFAIDGVSKHSTGTSLVNRAPDRSSAERFFAEDNIPLHRDIPAGPNGKVPVVHQAWMYESYLQSRFLRDGSSESTHDEQLEIVLASASDEPAMHWAMAFAKQHGLNFQEVAARARNKQKKIHRREIARRISGALSTFYLIGTSAKPIQDVYQGSLAAGDILRASPSRLHLLANLTAKGMAKLGALNSAGQLQ